MSTSGFPNGHFTLKNAFAANMTVHEDGDNIVKGYDLNDFSNGPDIWKIWLDNKFNLYTWQQSNTGNFVYLLEDGPKGCTNTFYKLTTKPTSKKLYEFDFVASNTSSGGTRVLLYRIAVPGCPNTFCLELPAGTANQAPPDGTPLVFKPCTDSTTMDWFMMKIQGINY